MLHLRRPSPLTFRSTISYNKINKTNAPINNERIWRGSYPERRVCRLPAIAILATLASIFATDTSWANDGEPTPSSQLRFPTLNVATVNAISPTPDAIITGTLHISGSSNAGSDGRTGLNINRYLGAERFYNAGYTGSRSIVANIEAGHASNSHIITTHQTQRITGTNALNVNDSHATSATHAMSGRLAGSTYPSNYYGFGIAHGAETWSGAIATGFTGGGGFTITDSSTASVYSTALLTGINGRTADVFNSSWGFTGPDGNNTVTVGVDGMLYQSGAIGVVSAGNTLNGLPPQPVGGIAAGYNAISVGALRSDADTIPYNRIATFSNRGPNDFFNAQTGQTVPNARAAVDIVAPGQNLTLAIGDTNATGSNQAGTSFSAPMVAGGAGLLVDAGRDLYAGNHRAIDGRVVKAVLLNSADKLPNWSNGQTLQSGVIRTTQSLDYTFGAGRMNLDQAFDQYVLTAAGGAAGTTDVAGLLGDQVANVGWDFGQVAINGSNRYFMEQRVDADTQLNVTLSWYIDNNPGNLNNFNGTTYNRFANLNLRVFQFDNLVDRNIIGTIAESISLYNAIEHLSFTVSETAFLGFEVLHAGNHWNFGNNTSGEFYGLAWSSTAVPEPSAAVLLVVACAIAGLRRRQRSR